MKKNTDILQIYEKLATPLIAAINEVSARQLMSGAIKDAPSAADDAQKIAGLLTALTKASVGISDKMDFSQKPEEEDDVRLALTTVLSPLIANLYQLSGQTPSDAEFQKIGSVFDTVNAYTDNFMALSKSADRLKTLDGQEVYADEDQVRLLTLSALMPAINAVTAFPFGQNPSKLLKSIGQRLLDEQAGLASKLQIADSRDEASQALGKVALLRALVMIYSQCHFAEMSRIMGLGEKAREEQISIDPVWKAFEQRVEMVAVLASVMSEGENAIDSSSSGSNAVAPQAEAGEVATEPQAPPAEPTQEASIQAPAEPEKQVEPQQEKPKGDPSNPMSFFSKKE